MSWEGVPWMVAGGQHSAEVGRVLAYAATGGGEGVAAAQDCKVRPSTIPDGNIHIQPGAVCCRNQFPGGGQQSYLARNVSDDVKAMTPQGSSGVRYDLVAVVIEDPQYAGQPDPVSVLNGPYARTAVYENVAATTKRLSQVDPDQTGYALALVKFDASDGTVTGADITDLRDLIRPHTELWTGSMFYAGGSGTIDELAVADNIPPGQSLTVPVPFWANRMVLSVDSLTLLAGDFDTDEVVPDVHGTITANLGALVSSGFAWEATAISTARPSAVGFGGNVGVKVSWEVDIPSVMRGTDQTFTLKAATIVAAAGQGVAAFTGTNPRVSITFVESVKSAL